MTCNILVPLIFYLLHNIIWGLLNIIKSCDWLERQKIQFDFAKAKLNDLLNSFRRLLITRSTRT